MPGKQAAEIQWPVVYYSVSLRLWCMTEPVSLGL